MHVPRPATAVAGRGRALPVPPGGVVGAVQQRLPAQRRPPLPRRRLAPGIRDARVRLADRPGRPRPGRRADPRGPARRRREAAARRGHRGRDLPVQEQHRLGRQLVRLPRELSRLPARRVRPARRRADPVPGHPPADLRRRQGAADAARRRVLPVAARRAHLGGRLQRHHPLPADHQHPRRAARRRRALPPPARHRRRLEHERGHHAAQGRQRRSRAADDRSRRGDARPVAGEPDPGHPRGLARRHRPPQGPPGQRQGGQRARDPAGVFREGQRVRRAPRRRPDRQAGRSSCGAGCSTRSRPATSTRSPARSTG